METVEKESPALTFLQTDGFYISLVHTKASSEPSGCNETTKQTRRIHNDVKLLCSFPTFTFFASFLFNFYCFYYFHPYTGVCVSVCLSLSLCVSSSLRLSARAFLVIHFIVKLLPCSGLRVCPRQLVSSFLSRLSSLVFVSSLSPLFHCISCRLARGSLRPSFSFCLSFSQLHVAPTVRITSDKFTE